MPLHLPTDSSLHSLDSRLSDGVNYKLKMGQKDMRELG